MNKMGGGNEGSGSKSSHKCQICGIVGHTAEGCSIFQPPTEEPIATKASEVVLTCQICKKNGHSALDCPLFCPPRCEQPGCGGLMRVLTSTTESNPGRKFLRCKVPGCNGFKWLGTKTPPASSTVASSSSSKCFYCLCDGHWRKYCPWVDSRCRKCGGSRVVRTKNEDDPGSKYFLCVSCGGCSLFSDEVKDEVKNDEAHCVSAEAKEVPGHVKLTIEGSLTQICDLFSKNVILSKK